MDYQKLLDDLTKVIEKTIDVKLDEKLDRRFAEYEVRMDEKLDRRFAEFEVRMDHKLDVKLAPIIQSLEELKKSNAEDHRRLERAIIKVDQKVDRLYSVFNLANEILQKGRENEIGPILDRPPVMA